MKWVGIFDTEAQSSEIVCDPVAGLSTIVTRNGEPVARIVPLSFAGIREFGFDGGLGRLAGDFEEPLPTDVLATYYK